jgi:hypothetical protein
MNDTFMISSNFEFFQFSSNILKETGENQVKNKMATTSDEI